VRQGRVLEPEGGGMNKKKKSNITYGDIIKLGKTKEEQIRIMGILVDIFREEMHRERLKQMQKELWRVSTKT